MRDRLIAQVDKRLIVRYTAPGVLPDDVIIDPSDGGGPVRYVPERTCNMVPLWEEPDANGYVTCECDMCGWMADYAADCAPTGWCAGCGAKVREEQ